MDLETTGLGERDKIIEIGAIKIYQGLVQTYQQLVNPSLDHISPRIFKLCRGLTAEGLRKAPTFDDIREEFLVFIGGFPLVCHNVFFEKRMLEKALGRNVKNIFLDSLELFCLFKPHFPGHGMEYLMQHYLKKERPEKHRALADARDTRELIERLFADLAGKDYDLLEDTIQKMQGTGWGWLPYLRNISPTSLKRTTSTAPADKTRKPRCIYSFGDIEGLLKNEEAWRKHFPGYIFRPEQLEMALSVVEIFQSEKALFMEASTGSGKTLAYLLPAIILAANYAEQVFISTNTKNLQQQVLDELPKIAAVLGIENMQFTDMKGISNYACYRRVIEETKNYGGDFEAKIAAAYLNNWVKRTGSGVLDDISYWFKRNNRHLGFLTDMVGCSREECFGDECTFKNRCFFRRQVERMRKSHVCLINHSLLLTWPGDYPEIKYLIADEAHTLEENSFTAFTVEVSSPILDHLLRLLVRNGDRGYLYYLLFYAKKVMPGLRIKQALDAVKEIDQDSKKISTLMNTLHEDKYLKRVEIPKDYAELEEAVLSLSNGLNKLVGFLQKTLTQICFKVRGFEETAIFRQGDYYMKTCSSMAVLLESCFAESEAEEDDDEKDCCNYLECSPKYWSFCVAPLDIAEHFYNKVLFGFDSMLLTSATLAEKIGRKRKYDRHVRTLGFNLLEREKVSFAVPIPDVYDYRQNSVLAIPDDSPGYNDESFADYAAKAIIGAAKILGGRTLAMFTSLERLQRVIEKARTPLEKEGISVLGGEGSSRRDDLEHFREDKNAVLFGSRSFFEGVDIPGPALSCIIIDKLSFPYQDDPLLRARGEYMQSKGLNPFDELSLATAKRTLRQQFGRLIRSETDRGFVLVLDQLNKRKSYRGRVLKELPSPQILKNVDLDGIMEFMKIKFSEWGYPTRNI
ncbi:MAG: DEAD/DEAH box helicase [Firmicutes bacterium]|nr:DEAD/DEAH box helicase [Bacillota bacterium]